MARNLYGRRVGCIYSFAFMGVFKANKIAIEHNIRTGVHKSTSLESTAEQLATEIVTDDYSAGDFRIYLIDFIGRDSKIRTCDP